MNVEYKGIKIREALSSIAVHSALELDNIILGNSDRRDDLKLLVERLKKLTADETWPAVLIFQAARDCKGLESPPRHVSDFIPYSKQIVARLDDIAQGKTTTDLTIMREFCLKLTRYARQKEDLYGFRNHFVA